MRILASLGLMVFCATLSFPLSAEAFGKRPSSSEVYQSQRAQPNPASDNNSRHDSNHRERVSVPEPSSIMLLGIGGSLVALISMRKWLRRSATK